MSAYPEFEPAPPAPAVRPPMALSYHVIVEPRKPKTMSDGGILLASRTRRANRATDYIGTIVALGSMAFKKNSTADLSQEPNWPKVGDLVVYKKHAGQRLNIRHSQQALVEQELEDEDHLLLMYDTDIMAVFKSEEDADQFMSWV